jgi:hypothetical protein
MAGLLFNAVISTGGGALAAVVERPRVSFLQSLSLLPLLFNCHPSPSGGSALPFDVVVALAIGNERGATESA